MFESDMTDNLQISTIFGFMRPEYREAVVQRALDSRRKVSKAARGLLNSAINSTVKVPQFPKEPAKAPTPYLREHVLKAVTIFDRLTGAILKVWTESHDALRDVVVKHLDNLAMPAEYPDFSGDQFRGTWFSDVWEREIDKILERHGEFDRDDVALMLCYVSGKIPGSRETKDNALAQGLEYLRSLPPNAPEWEQEIPEFIEALNAIREKKEEQRGLAIALDDAIAVVVDDFSAEMTFFQQDAAWSADQLPPDADIAKALELTEELQSLLIEYQSIYGIAPVLSEERVRRQKRAKLEPRILPILDHIDQLMTGDQGPDDGFPSGMDNFEDATGAEADRPDQAGTVADGSSFPEEGGQTKNGKIDEQPLELDDVKSEIANGHAFSEENYTSLQSENRRLQREVKSVHRRLDKSQNEVEKWKKDAARWRGYYIDEASKRAATSGEDEDLVIENVNDAVELAQKRYEDKLLFQLNGKSRVEDNPFEKPKVVYEALKWLASVYREVRLGKINLPDLDVSIRQACGWWYKEWQGKRTVKKLSAWYTTKVGDKTYWLHKHIGTGSRRDARYTIRIAFEWDEIKERVVIGFIGRHQKTFAK